MATVLKGRRKGRREGEREEVLAMSGTSSSEEEEEEGRGEEDIRRWGSRKKSYYGGNTGEEMGEEEVESDLEEDRAEEREAAKLQARQLATMAEEDFLDTFALPEQAEAGVEERVEAATSSTRDLGQLSRRELVAVFRQRAPEFAGVTADFEAKMAEAGRLARVVALAEEGRLPAGPQLDFVRTKLQLLLNYSTNIAAYLVLRASGASLTLHPVTARLVQARALLDATQPMDALVMPGVEALLRRLDGGEEVEALAREERRRARGRLEASRRKKLQLLEEEEQVVPEKKKRKRNKKRKAGGEEEAAALENLEALTRDEKMAVELYNVIKKTKKNEDLEESSEEEDDLMKSLETEDAADETVAATTNEGAEYDEDGERRAITHKIAKNKGLMPKRSKLQRNPRLKNRMKFEKATKKRKGAVRPLRDQKEKYSGEASGLNVRVKKGVKLS